MYIYLKLHSLYIGVGENIINTMVRDSFIKSLIEGSVCHQLVVILRIKQQGVEKLISQISYIETLIIYLSNCLP